MAEKTSIFTPQRTVKFFIVSFIGTTIACMIIWPILELLFSKIDNSTYTWTWLNGIVEPLVFGLLATIVEFVGWNFFHKTK